ncbi:prion-inhibition and propagation-domain-containing protein [Dactylonectria estremocensis]|uniref:Prion-inhibition and propagation-domain-containing protein n=1 Tax=Dactylonectria estremocensis TaxID=1079267 RepID=A0A9P9J6N1_9HYPO|nr:prion-inhibition and propagation-domain-containing protein [Dactylonectria estremocensis]
MDPISLAGLGLGVASLTFELFSICVKGYNLLLEAEGMPKSCQYLLVRLAMEKEKLLGWAVLTNISEGDAATRPALRLNRHTVTDALREIQVLLLDAAQLDNRYKLKLILATNKSSDKSEDDQSFKDKTLRNEYSTIQQKALDFISKTRKYPKRLQWAAFDKANFEDLLSNLRVLNDDMMGFLEAYERKRHFQMQEATFMQILQVNNRMDDLVELLHSLKGTAVEDAKQGQANNFDQRTYEDRLIRLTRFKAISIAIETQTTHINEPGPRMILDNAVTGAELSLAKLTEIVPVNDEEDEQHQRSHGLYDGTSVWVEWRYYEGVDEDEEPPPFIVQRISKLAKLLRDGMKPAEFLVPDCLGYIHQQSHCRFGFVYRCMESLGRDVPISLFELLSTIKKPSLTTRIRIACAVANSIWYLHATNWLHKGLRSENIAFQDRRQIRCATPFLCGFDYSRPSGIGEETEQPSQNPLHEMYRHPETQFDFPRDGRTGFKKAHDIYSLGVVMFEIGVWKPVSGILGIDTAKPVKASMVKKVQSELLSAENLELLESEAGDVFAAAVKTCLDGTLAPTKALQSPETDSQLQASFGEHVVKSLEKICV